MAMMYGSGSFDPDDKMVDDEEDEEDEEDQEQDQEQEASSHTNQIEKLEAKMLQPKEWSMKGEVGATDRPRESILSDEFPVEHGAKRAPVITQEVSESLEERIRQRIRNNIFEDVQPKVQSLASPKDITKRKALDHEKSKLSLMDLYEKEYLDKMKVMEGKGGDTAEELTKEQEEELNVIRRWRELSGLLRALSHQHFVPQAPHDNDVRTLNNAPSLRVEEPTPMAVGGSTLLAPQDTYAPSGRVLPFKSEEELTREDRKTVRRAVKTTHKAAVERKEMRKRTQAKEVAQAKLPELPADDAKYEAPGVPGGTLHPKAVRARKMWAKR
eukprot:NODE_1289_length_1202_cov_14.722463_g1058_i0.p1 GENE.NODE_1289_length_1202_cov_14.722463_g1058_i0~~NODE_1289_length_1202_cov_14.722463_g1058_i0.p1  ORF type:complete len:371 (-),score=140.40 NODE_1289_length_1202_cov_14.722463_g1058_i0:88-1068(-)